jgi:hypothetical protein
MKTVMVKYKVAGYEEGSRADRADSKIIYIKF